MLVYTFILMVMSIIHYLTVKPLSWGIVDLKFGLVGRLVQNSEFQNWPQFNSGIGIGIELAPPPQDVEFELELQEMELSSWQFNEILHSHTQKECVESYIQYIQSQEGYFGNVIDCYKLPIFNVICFTVF